LLNHDLGLTVTRPLSGRVGGDQQIGARIAEGTTDLHVFFLDPHEPQTHNPDAKALLLVAAVWNTAVACNMSRVDLTSWRRIDGPWEPVRVDTGSILLAAELRRSSPKREGVHDRRRHRRSTLS